MPWFGFCDSKCWIKVPTVVNGRGKTNADQVKDIFDILKSYYKIAGNAIYQQVVSRLLLDGDQSSLKILCAELIAKLTDNQLEQIAGEDSASRSKRQRLDGEIEGYEAAIEIFWN